MTKYRIRLKNERVIGPFDFNQIFDLKSKGHIQGNEDTQVFPLGEWRPMSTFDFYANLMDENKTIIVPKNEDSTFVIDLTQIRQKINENEIEKLSENVQVPTISHLTETIRVSPTQANGDVEELKKTRESQSNSTQTISQKISMDGRPTDREDKTVINPAAQEEILKMRRLQGQQEKEARAFEEERHKQIVALKENSGSRQSLVVSSTDETQVISLNNKTELLNRAQMEELNNDKEVQDFLNKRRDEEVEEDSFEDVENEVEVAAKAKKKKTIIIVAALALLFVFLFPADNNSEKPPYRHLAPEIIFAVPFDKKDSKASGIFYQKGMDSYLVGTYPRLINAGGFFRKSVENDFDNISAYSMMVRTYGEQLKFSKKKLEDALNLFKMIQVKKQYLIHSPDGVVGMNLFFMGIDKPEAAADVVKKYLRLYPKKVTQDLFAAYILSLLKIGRVDEAKRFIGPLAKDKNKSRFALEALIEYLRLNQETEQAMALVNEGIKKYPNTSYFFLLKCDLLLRKKEIQEIPKLISMVEAKNIEYNDVYRAKFFEITGFYWALKGNPKLATKFLMASLKIVDSVELRMKLADLEKTGGSDATDKIILQSQAAKFLVEAKAFYHQKNYSLAMSSAARGTDVYPGFIPAELFLAKMQMKLGLGAESLKTLEKLIQLYPGSKDINLALVEAYIDSYKFTDAKRRIAVVSGSEIRYSWEYASVNARLYQKMGDPLKAIAWLKSSINANQLNDSDIYILAEILLKRKNFDQARQLLNSAMELDPLKAEYRISYARLLYETEDDQAAIGYLLGLSNDFGEEPKVLGEIATLYYKSGKIKDFQDHKTKLEKLPTKDKALYEFLIKAAILDERYNEVPGLVEELLKVEPGDLEAMMTAGKVLFENDKFSEAAIWFKRLQGHMPTYPKVLFYIAKIKAIIGEIDDPVDELGNPVFEKVTGERKLGALSLVKNDIKENGESDIALVFMGEIFIKKGDFIQAENYFKKAQKLNPKSYEALIGLADLSTRRNNFDLALDLYKKAMKQRGDEAVIHKKIGDVYRLLNQGTLAIESYKLYLEMDPEASDKAQIDKYINLMQ